MSEERGKEMGTDRKIVNGKVVILHYFENGDTTETSHTDVADNCYADKLGMKDVVERLGKKAFVYLNPEGEREEAVDRTAAARKYG